MLIVAVLKQIHPDITAEYADLSKPGDWHKHFSDASAVVMLQAQIGGHDYAEFVCNNVNSTRLILDAIKAHKIPYLVHISSSVVESVANDFYTRTKKDQESVVLRSEVPSITLRPTLMFGWFDRKHLGWLSRFMKKIRVFPIPGNGKYIRQPLYVGDFCNIIINCIENNIVGGIYNISGHEKINYIDMIREIRRAIGVKAGIIRIPYRLFHGLIWLWGLMDKNPPFTVQQLEALRAKDEFEIIDWPHIFATPYTPFEKAINMTFNDPIYSKVILEF